MKIKRINSRNKGATGEREFAKVLQDAGLSARRGQQFHGGPGSPDVVCDDLTGVHFEVKRTQRQNIYDWLKQAKHDAAEGSLSVIVHRQNRSEWVAIVPIGVMLDLLKTREGFFL